MAEINKIPLRSEVAVEDTWATEDMYPSDEAWEQELASVAEDQKVLAAYAGHLADSAETLCQYLLRMEQTNVKAELLANYASRKADEDTRNATYQAMYGKLMGVLVGLEAAVSFETPEVMAISDEALEAFYQEAGRAGRNKELVPEAMCRILYTPEDKKFQNNFSRKDFSLRSFLTWKNNCEMI